MKYWIISDTHFRHKLLVEIWDREKWFETTIIRNLRQIPNEDTLIHLWDICIWYDKKVHDWIISTLGCKKILVLWNHDKKSNQRYTENWRDFVCNSITINKYWKEVLLVHIPTDESQEWVNKKDDRLVIHWHRHTFKRFDRWIHPFDKHKLYSCEIEKMQPRTLEYMIYKK